MCVTFSPRVVGHLRPDFYSLEMLLASPQFAGKSGEDLVLAIYNYFTSKVDGTYHFWPCDEHKGNPRLRRDNSDPVKLLNACGWAICGQTSTTLYGLYRAAGLKARQIGLPGHSLCEVFYDGRWHVLDVDMWTWFRTEAGHIASAYELTRRPRQLIVENANKSNPCNLPDRSLEAYAEMYAKTEVADDHVKTVCPHWGIRAHTMDFRLRPGETLVRAQENQGRFHMPQDWKECMQRFAREWHGQPRERYEPFRTFGNGRWMYEPDLTDAAEDFQAGLWQGSDLGQDSSGLVGPGRATFRIQSPYPFCGRPNWEGEIITASDGVWLTLAGESKVVVEINDPEGEWRTVFSSAGAFDRRIDVTENLDGRYECLIRLSLEAGARLRRFRFEGFILTAPLSVPRLAKGDNPMELRCLDKRGLATVPWSEVIDFRQSADLSGRWAGASNAECKAYVDGWQMIAPAGEGPVSATFRFDAPQGRKFAWAYVHASLREGPPGQPQRPASLQWSRDGKKWNRLAETLVPNTHLQWDGSIDGEADFPRGAGNVLIRITSGTAISGVEFYGHLAEKASERDGLVITHRWREGERNCSFQTPAGAKRYVVACGASPSAHTIEMTVPSRRRGR